MRRSTIFLFFFLVVCSFSVFSDWDTYQSNVLMSGYYTSEVGVISNPTASYVEAGSNSVPPLIYDLDQDGRNEVVVAAGAYIEVYGVDDNNNLQQEASLFINQTVNHSFSVYSDYDDDGYREIVVGNDELYVLEYNGTSSAYEILFEETLPTPLDTGITCQNLTVNGEFNCVFGLRGCEIGVYPIGGTVNNTSLSGGDYCLSSDYQEIDKYLTRPPLIISNWYGDLHDHALFISNYEADEQDSLILFDLDDKALETAFDSDGVVEDTTNTNNWLMSAAFYSTAGYQFSDSWPFISMSSGGRIFVYSAGFGADSDNEILLYDSSGTLRRTSTVDTNANFRGQGNLIIGEVVDDSSNVVNDNNFEYCAYSYDTADDDGEAIVKCFDVNSGLVVYSGQGYISLLEGTCSNYANCVRSNNLIAVQLNESADEHEQLVLPGMVLDTSSSTLDSFNYSDLSTRHDYGQIAVSDLNDDDNLDLCLSYNNILECYFSLYDNALPVLNAPFGRNYASPVCAETTVTYTGAECGNSPCQYSNDLSIEQERLVSNCGNGSTQLTNGSYSAANPEFSCYFGNPGNYQFRLYIQDSANDDDYSQYETVNVLVINGTAGEDCNLPVNAEVLNPSANTSANYARVNADDELTTEEDITYFVETLTGQSTFINYFLVIIITLGLVWAAFQAGIKNPITVGMIIFAVWIICALLGLLAWVWVILYTVVAVAGSAIMFVIGRPGTGGDNG